MHEVSARDEGEMLEKTAPSTVEGTGGKCILLRPHIPRAQGHPHWVDAGFLEKREA